MNSNELHRLNIFIGKWDVSGTSYAEGSAEENLKSSSVKLTSVETYEWILDNSFLLHHWNGKVGDSDFKGMEVLGFDKKNNLYTSSFFDNSGNYPTYKVSLKNNIWTYSGEFQKATFEFNDNENSIAVHWDWKKPGTEKWLPLCDLTATKIKLI